MKKRKIFLFGLLVLFLISIFLIVHKFVKQEENSYSATDNRSDISQRIETDTINMSMIYEQNVIYEKKFDIVFDEKYFFRFTGMHIFIGFFDLLFFFI